MCYMLKHRGTMEASCANEKKITRAGSVLLLFGIVSASDNDNYSTFCPKYTNPRNCFWLKKSHNEKKSYRVAMNKNIHEMFGARSHIKELKCIGKLSHYLALSSHPMLVSKHPVTLASFPDCTHLLTCIDWLSQWHEILSFHYFSGICTGYHWLLRSYEQTNDPGNGGGARGLITTSHESFCFSKPVPFNNFSFWCAFGMWSSTYG